MYSSIKDNLNFDIAEIQNSDVSLIQASISILVVLFFIYLYKKINMGKII